MQEYKVLRRHDGDREYHEGDIREAKASDVAHLVPGVLLPLKGETAAEGGGTNAANGAPEGATPKKKTTATNKKAKA